MTDDAVIQPLLAAVDAGKFPAERGTKVQTGAVGTELVAGLIQVEKADAGWRQVAPGITSEQELLWIQRLKTDTGGSWNNMMRVTSIALERDLNGCAQSRYGLEKGHDRVSNWNFVGASNSSVT